MAAEAVFQGTLFTSDFLAESITRSADWRLIDDAAIDQLQSDLTKIFAGFPTQQTPNETRTEDDLIWPILSRLGWDHFVRQQNLSSHGREDVPDGLLFTDAIAKRQTKGLEDYQLYEAGTAIVESKRWKRPLDRRSSMRGEELAPSTQMLRYLRRADVMTNGKLKWGILTNGGRWRLYYSGARSVSEQFFEIDLSAVLGVEQQGDLLAPRAPDEIRHALRIFALVFRREAFVPSGVDRRTFHQRAIEEGKFYEERVATDLSNLVFTQLYPLLARSIASADETASLDDVRHAALILLYRLLFILYAEDRDLLPVNDARYRKYGLRDNVRMDVAASKAPYEDRFSSAAAKYWGTLDDLCRAINKGDTSIGLPPYNGGLFDTDRTPLLTKIRLPDTVMAEVIDRLSFERKDGEQKYINYRDLSVQQLGSIYERLLEHEVVRVGLIVDIRPNIFARKGSGSYYTPDDLVNLIIRETLEPLIASRMEAFRQKAAELAESDQEQGLKLAALKRFDPAERLLDLRICDPAMGSGHFLVSLVDYLSDQVIAAIAETETLVKWASQDHPYISPLTDRIETIRSTIMSNAEERNWTVDSEQLDDRHIIRRMVLKRCVYGVDKNPMAVELAKVALWLHSFTVGAPLSFLDHHLRCGDSLFGSWVKTAIDKATRYGSPLLLHEPIKAAYGSAASMQLIEGLPDAEIAEAHRSQEIFKAVRVMTEPLTAFLSLLHAIEWISPREPNDLIVLRSFFDGEFGDPILIASGKAKPVLPGVGAGAESLKNHIPAADKFARINTILNDARTLITEERFLHWQVAFPGVWSDWHEKQLTGGFDAIIGNPPWDLIKLQQVEWFAARRREIAMAQKASDRQKMIANLEFDRDPLALDYIRASDRADAASRMARSGGDYPLLSGGDINIYSLFVERAMRLVKPDGIIGLLTPSGIASDKTAAKFFKQVAGEGRLKALYDFENKGKGRKPYFPNVHNQAKFCAFIAARKMRFDQTACAFFLDKVSDLANPDRRFPLNAADFLRVNPNTGTAPVFRTKKDAQITTAIYSNAPVLEKLSGAGGEKIWPIKYATTYHMTNASASFRTRSELQEKEKAWPVGNNRFQNSEGLWVPLYEGKMIWHFDHRAASILINSDNQHRQAYPKESADYELNNPSFVPEPQFWVLAVDPKDNLVPVFSFRDVTNPTDHRTMDACFIPYKYAGNTLQLLTCEKGAGFLAPLLANFNSIIFDYVCRQKVQKNHLSWYIVQQLPVIPPESFETTLFGNKTAGQIVRESVLELSYTSHDMAELARQMGYVDSSGEVKKPFIWNAERRLKLLARLDAIFFHLYGVKDRDDVRYIYSTFRIVEKKEAELYSGRYRSRDLCLAYINALAAGQPDAEIDL